MSGWFYFDKETRRWVAPPEGWEAKTVNSFVPVKQEGEDDGTAGGAKPTVKAEEKDDDVAAGGDASTVPSLPDDIIGPTIHQTFLSCTGNDARARKTALTYLRLFRASNHYYQKEIDSMLLDKYKRHIAKLIRPGQWDVDYAFAHVKSSGLLAMCLNPRVRKLVDQGNMRQALADAVKHCVNRGAWAPFQNIRQVHGVLKHLCQNFANRQVTDAGGVYRFQCHRTDGDVTQTVTYEYIVDKDFDDERLRVTLAITPAHKAPSWCLRYVWGFIARTLDVKDDTKETDMLMSIPDWRGLVDKNEFTCDLKQGLERTPRGLRNVFAVVMAMLATNLDEFAVNCMGPVKVKTSQPGKQPAFEYRDRLMMFNGMDAFSTETAFADM